VGIANGAIFTGKRLVIFLGKFLCLAWRVLTLALHVFKSSYYVGVIYVGY
jgi:hypothetical protein